jgi:pimeloyl-ACP methyl ester carboxylesterase
MADWHAGCPMMAVRPEDSIRDLRSPVLLLHSRGDGLIPVEHGMRVYANAPEPKRLCVFELPGHCDGFFAQKERYRAEVVAIVAARRPR